MNVTIPKSLESLVRQKVAEGHYSTEDEVVADALRLMQARDEVAEIKRARLKDRFHAKPEGSCSCAGSNIAFSVERDLQEAQ